MILSSPSDSSDQENVHGDDQSSVSSGPLKSFSFDIRRPFFTSPWRHYWQCRRIFGVNILDQNFPQILMFTCYVGGNVLPSSVQKVRRRDFFRLASRVQSSGIPNPEFWLQNGSLRYHSADTPLNLSCVSNSLCSILPIISPAGHDTCASMFTSPKRTCLCCVHVRCVQKMH